MEVIVSARHHSVPEGVRRTAEEKVRRLTRFLDGMERAEVHFTEERNPRIVEREICEVTIEGHGHHVRCKVRAHDASTAVDQAVAKLEHQLHKLKTKLQRRNQGQVRGGGRPPAGDVLVPPAALDSPGSPTELAAPGSPATADGTQPVARAGTGGPRIVKSKRFAVMPMTPEDAVQRMDLLGHGFFFFTNIDTGRAAVVYRRDDGDIGLIDETG